MRVHVVHAHPSPASFSATLAARAVETLKAAGHEVDVLDLYAEGFDPVLRPAEWDAFFDPRAGPAGATAQIERLKRAEALVLIYPTWWYGLPAILKGWFDRVWAPGVAFELDPAGGPIRPALTQMRRFVAITTHGSPWWFIGLWLGNPGRTVLMRGLSRLAPRATSIFLGLYGMEPVSAQRRARFLARVERAMRAL